MTKILIIEDDRSITNLMRVLLSAQGYEVLEAKNANIGITLALSYQPEIIVLDLGLPDMDGIDLISQIRHLVQSSILVVSAREKQSDKINALDLGADDYLTKPFNAQEFLARIRVAIRHQKVNQDEVSTKILKVLDLQIDIDAHRFWIKNKEVHLTPIEFDILALLATHHGKVLTHAFMVRHIWGEGSLDSDTQTLRVTMANLRRKIEENPGSPYYIVTEIGIGYRLKDE